MELLLSPKVRPTPSLLHVSDAAATIRIVCRMAVLLPRTKALLTGRGRALGSRHARWLAPIAMFAVLVGTCVLYLRALDSAPMVVAVDEARFALHAHSLVTHRTDLAGNRWPLFFHITDPLNPASDSETWWQPALFYLVAAVFRFVPPATWSLRLPIAILAIVNVILIALAARKLFSKGWYAVVAAGILALTPAHYMMSSSNIARGS